MTIETDIPGDASGLISLGSWLSAAPGDAVSGAGDHFSQTRVRRFQSSHSLLERGLISRMVRT